MIKIEYQYLATANELIDPGNVLQWLLASQIKSENDQASTFLQGEEQKNAFVMTQGCNQQNPVWEALQDKGHSLYYQIIVKEKKKKRGRNYMNLVSIPMQTKYT